MKQGSSKKGDFPAEVVDVLHRHLPQSIVDVVLSQVAERCADRDWTVAEDREARVAALARAAAVFLRGAEVIRCREDLQRAGRYSSDFVRGARFHQSVACDADAERAQSGAMDFARAWGASERVVARVGTVVGELARNIARHASAGDVVGRCDGAAFHLVASDRGPGIENLQDVISGNYQSPSGLGLGLPGVKRIAATFDAQTVVGEGTTVTVSFGLEVRRRVSA